MLSYDWEDYVYIQLMTIYSKKHQQLFKAFDPLHFYLTLFLNITLLKYVKPVPNVFVNKVQVH